MKVISSILILLVISAFVLPEVDLWPADETGGHACCASSKVEEAMDQCCKKQHEAPLTHEEGCSSSCHCLCCVAVFLPFSSRPDLTVEIPDNFHPVFVLSDHFFDFHNKVWQPPRAG